MAEEQMNPRYAKLEKPEFHSTIPHHLVDKLSQHEKYLVETLSRMEAQTDWTIRAVLEENRGLLETDVRLQEVQEWKKMLCSKWAVIAIIATALIPALIAEAVSRWIKH
jgi:hypothetical protein